MNNTAVDLCTVTLLGNLVNTPEIRYQTNPVVAIAELTLATHNRWFDKNTQQFKEWTNYHTIKVIGDAVERALIHAQKGDVILIEGYLLNSKRSQREIIHARFAQHYAKGFAQSINQINVSGSLCSDIKLVTTENNKILAEFQVAINHQILSVATNQYQNHQFTRTVHLWGKAAQQFQKNAAPESQVVISGKLNYFNNDKNKQLIDAKQIDLLKS